MSKSRLWLTVSIFIVGFAVTVWPAPVRFLSRDESQSGTYSYRRKTPLVLSETSLQKLPPEFPTYLILGTDPAVMAGRQREADGKLYIQVELAVAGPPAATAREYEEFFKAAGWRFSAEWQDIRYVIAAARTADDEGSPRAEVEIETNGPGTNILIQYERPVPQ